MQGLAYTPCLTRWCDGVCPLPAGSPLGLRLSSQLLLGVARIYGRQVKGHAVGVHSIQGWQVTL